MRPARLENRVDAHILIAFLAYCLQVTLKNRLQILQTSVFTRMALIPVPIHDTVY